MELEGDIEGDSAVMKEPQPWIIEQIIGYLEDRNLELSDDLLTKQLKHELLDIIEQKYFKQALFELLSKSFDYCVVQYLVQ